MNYNVICIQFNYLFHSRKFEQNSFRIKLPNSFQRKQREVLKSLPSPPAFPTKRSEGGGGATRSGEGRAGAGGWVG